MAQSKESGRANRRKGSKNDEREETATIKKTTLNSQGIHAEDPQRATKRRSGDLKRSGNRSFEPRTEPRNRRGGQGDSKRRSEVFLGKGGEEFRASRERGLGDAHRDLKEYEE